MFSGFMMHLFALRPFFFLSHVSPARCFKIIFSLEYARVAFSLDIHQFLIAQLIVYVSNLVTIVTRVFLVYLLIDLFIFGMSAGKEEPFHGIH
jgi:hypothetical protein